MVKRKTFHRDYNNTVRIGPRISKPLYVLAKYVYSLQGVYLEDRIEELLRKDVEYAMKQKWFVDMAAGVDGKDLQLFNMAFGASNNKKSAKGKCDDEGSVVDEQFSADWKEDV